MKKAFTVMISTFVLIIIFSSLALAERKSFYIVPGKNCQFALDSMEGGRLYVWGTNIKEATGYATLSTDVDLNGVSLGVIQSWFYFLTSYSLAEKKVRIFYDDEIEGGNPFIYRIGPP